MPGRCENCAASETACLVLTSQYSANKVGRILHFEILFDTTHHCKLKTSNLIKPLSKHYRQPSEIYSFAQQVSY